jgi:DNA-binding CsgD family transcriptional regulator/tetratricopeptide (TPR) repeat protein
MLGGGALVGRDRECALLEDALAGLAGSRGGVLLLSGEAGVGKTALVETVLGSAPVRVLRGAGHPGPVLPYEPLLRVLRDGRLRAAVDAETSPAERGRMSALPGVAGGTGDVDPHVAVCEALELAVAGQPTVVFLDDLHWADGPTLELLERWAPTLADAAVLLIGAYRSDGLARRHPLRRLRAQLRRGRGVRELSVEPLDEAGTASLLGHRLGEQGLPELAAVIHERAQGVPFYVEALADAVATEVAAGSTADPHVAAAVVPDRIRDAVLLRLEALSPSAVELAEVAAAAGTRMPLAVAVELSGETAVDELCDSGLLEEVTGPSGHAEAAFAHALVRDALYAATPWTRRRAHHRRLAAAFEAGGHPPNAVAAQWLSAGEAGRARPWLVAAAQEACAAHAYRDAGAAIRTALESWPAGEDRSGHVAALELWARCAERCGELDDAVAAFGELVATHRSAGDDAAVAESQRRLASVQELRGDWPAALAARALAADAFDRVGRRRDGAAERLAMAGHLHSTGSVSDALRLVVAAAGALPSDDVPLRARALGLEGLVRAKLGDGERGVALAREGLSVALTAGLHDLSADAYYLWADALEQAARYPEALNAWSTAFDYCQAQGLDATAQVCLACLVPALRHTGQWQQAAKVCDDVFANPAAPEPARMVAAGELGLILAARGETKPARRHLTAAFAFAEATELFGLEIDTSWGLARVEEAESLDSAAAQRLSRLVRRCASREERHYAVAALRWAASFFAQRGLSAEVAACADALSRIAGATGAPEALAALSCAHSESAMLEGDPHRAADGFEQALSLLAPLDLPPETAEVALRGGVAWGAVGGRDRAVELLVTAYHTARNLRARPLALCAARELALLGEDVGRRLGRRAAGDLARKGLSRRELEVLRLVAQGLTNREIGQGLFVSTRTVDMHMRNLLAKLGCRARAEAVSRAADLGLLDLSRPAEPRP